MTFSFVGIDLAWGPRARTGIAVLEASGRLAATSSVVTDTEIHAALEHTVQGDVVAAIDAPLIVTNESGRRPCEQEITRLFGAYHAGAHASNLSKPWFQPAPRGALLAERLGWNLDPSMRPKTGTSCAIEVYPHPAMVSLFELDRVIPYKNKKSRDFESLLLSFSELLDHMERVCGDVLQLGSSGAWEGLRRTVGSASRKSELGRVEDEVDAVLCAYLAWLWVSKPAALTVYGDFASGYIVSPPPPVNPARRTTRTRRSKEAVPSTASLAARFMAANRRLTAAEAEELAIIAEEHASRA